MHKITVKEEEIMNFFWERGDLFVNQVLEYFTAPKPHYNTISTMVRALAEKGFLGYTAFGNTYQYFPLITIDEYRKTNLKMMAKKYYGNSYKNVVTALIDDGSLSLEELKELIREIERKRRTLS